MQLAAEDGREPRQMQRVVTVFIRAASHELLPKSAYRRLAAVETRRRGALLACGDVPVEPDPASAGPKVNAPGVPKPPRDRPSGPPRKRRSTAQPSCKAGALFD
jgi:hypothetical protein